MGPRHALGRATLSCLLTLAALLPAGCNGSSRAEAPAAPPPGSSGTPQPPATGRTAAPAVDPDHSVDRPGRRSGAVAFPDVLVTRARTIDHRTVAAVRRLDGVQDVERISLAEVLIENRAVQVAAVGPATYRNYTVAASADTQDVWERLAGGEVALRPGLRTRLPIDRQGFLRLGGAESAPRVHIGAYAP